MERKREEHPFKIESKAAQYSRENFEPGVRVPQFELYYSLHVFDQVIYPAHAQESETWIHIWLWNFLIVALGKLFILCGIVKRVVPSL